MSSTALFVEAGAVRAGRASGLVPGVSLLPLVGGHRAKDVSRAQTLVLNDVEIDRDRLAAYDRVCGFPLSDALPATYPHILAFPLPLSLMTDPRASRFRRSGWFTSTTGSTQHRPLAVSERPGEPACLGHADRARTPAGRQFSLRSEVRASARISSGRRCQRTSAAVGVCR